MVIVWQFLPPQQVTEARKCVGCEWKSGVDEMHVDGDGQPVKNRPTIGCVPSAARLGNSGPDALKQRCRSKAQPGSGTYLNTNEYKWVWV